MAVSPPPGDENVVDVVHDMSGSDDPVHIELPLQLLIFRFDNLDGVDLHGAHGASSIRDHSRCAVHEVHRTQYGCGTKSNQSLDMFQHELLNLLIVGSMNV